MATVVTGSPPEKRIAPGPHAPSGPSVAAKMVSDRQRREWGQHYTRRVRSEAAQRQAKSSASRQAASAPYNALNSPFKTQGQFNSAVLANAKSQYQPELDQLNTEEQGEQGLHQTREGENAKTYQQYSEQAQAAYDKAKQALGEIAARQNSGTAQGQATLQAALSNTGVAGLAAVPNQAQFTAQAAGIGNADSQALAGEQAGIAGEFGKDLLVPGAGRAEAQFKEQARTTGKLNTLGLERKKVLARIPDIQTKTRADMTKEEQAREANRIQTQLASGKLGLEKTTQAQNNAVANRTLNQKGQEAREANTLKLQELAQNSGLEWAKIQVQREDLAQKASEARGAKAVAAAKAAGERFDKGLQIMASYLHKDDKAEFQPTGTLGDKTKENEKLRPYQRNAMHLYKMLTEQGNLTAPEAFRIMGSSGNGYVEQFAREHEAIYNNANKNRTSPNKGKPISRLPKPTQPGKHWSKLGK